MMKQKDVNKLVTILCVDNIVFEAAIIEDIRIDAILIISNDNRKVLLMKSNIIAIDYG